jgi:hypothetical protein
MGQKRNTCKIMFGMPEGKINLGDIDVDDRTIIKRITES